MGNIIDSVDQRILRELQKDSSRPLTQLAAAVGMSHAPCWRRVQRLRSEGFIAREVAVLDLAKLGWEMEAYVFLKVSPHGRANIKEFKQAIGDHEQVIGLYVLMGNVDFMLHVVARNIADYNRFVIDHVSGSPHISEINSMAVLARLKESGVPI